jgi:hypothetical protein
MIDMPRELAVVTLLPSSHSNGTGEKEKQKKKLTFKREGFHT